MRSFRKFTIGILALSSAAVIALPSSGAAASASPVNYADLGDSYASGVGTPDQGDSPCYRSDQAFGEQWAVKRGVAFPDTFAACSGDTTSAVTESQLTHLSDSTTLVSVIAGGDDVGFVSVMGTCHLPGDDLCMNAINTAKSYATNTLPKKLDAMFTAIHNHARNAKVIALDYPEFYDRTAKDCLNLGDTKRMGGDTKRQAIDDGIKVLDDEIEKAAKRNNVAFADVYDKFSGHELCDREPWLHDDNILTTPNPYHPTLVGYSNVYLPALTAAAAAVGQ